jgi:DNA polymerase-4
VGRATQIVLEGYGIRTIGDLARSNPKLLEHRLKSRAYQLVQFANGQDYSAVMHKEFEVPAKSVGHGITTVQDLEESYEVWRVILELCQDIGRKLREYKKKACVIGVVVKDNALFSKMWQKKIATPTQSTMTIAEEAYALFQRSYDWHKPIRAITVTAMDLISEDIPFQIDLFTDVGKLEKRSRLDSTIDEIRRRFGVDSIRNATLVKGEKIINTHTHITMPTGMNTVM